MLSDIKRGYAQYSRISIDLLLCLKTATYLNVIEF